MGEGEEGGGGQGGGGEQIKSCQMEILGFKRSETGVKGFASLRRLYVLLIGVNLCGSTPFRAGAFSTNSCRRVPNRRHRQRG